MQPKATHKPLKVIVGVSDRPRFYFNELNEPVELEPCDWKGVFEEGLMRSYPGMKVKMTKDKERLELEVSFGRNPQSRPELYALMKEYLRNTPSVSINSLDIEPR